MEEVKTSIEKLFDQFNADNASFSIPKCVSSLNESFETASKKRKLSLENHMNNDDTFNDLTSGTRSSSTMRQNDTSSTKNNSSQLNETFLNALNSSSASSGVGGSGGGGGVLPPASPWEIRRLKWDISDVLQRMAEMEREVKRRAHAHVCMESMYTEKVNRLQQQLDTTNDKLRDTDKHLKHIRKREWAEKEELIKLTKQMSEQKFNYTEQIEQLQRERKDLESTLSAQRCDLNEQIARLTEQNSQLERHFTDARDELERVQTTIVQAQETRKKYSELDRQYQLQQFELQNAQRRIKELEIETADFGSWKETSQSLQKRAAKIPELERELERLKSQNKNVHSAIGNKLLLEEEVYDLKSRLEKQERAHEDYVALKTQIHSLEHELREYKAVASDHCQPTGPISANHLRARIEEILKKDLLLVNEKSSVKTEKDSASVKALELQQELDALRKQNESLQTTIKLHRTSTHRLQKKLGLVAKERDCYKQLIDNYEKELTITGNALETNNMDNQLRTKVDMLEKTIAGYKEMCANLEQELATSKTLPDHGLLASSDSYQQYKKNIELLRQENERLRRRKDELELIVEHSSLKGAYNIDKFKVLHMQMNPTEVVYEEHKVQVEKLQVEIERLKRKNRKLEQDHDEITMKLNETANIANDLQELANLREQIKSMENKNAHLKEIYKSASQEFREVCYLLFGYRVDRVGSNKYRISSMFAETEGEYLNFRLAETGDLEMLESEYSSSLSEMIGIYLGQQHSLPAFLCTLTLELYNRTTIIN